MTKPKKREKPRPPENAPRKVPNEGEEEIDFPTVLWSLVVLAVLVLIHRLVWGG